MTEKIGTCARGVAGPGVDVCTVNPPMVPVIDGVAAAVGIVEATIRIGVRTSKRDEFAVPPAKEYTRLVESFAL